MKKIISLGVCCVILLGLFIGVSAASRSTSVIQSGRFNNIISWTISEDPDDPIEDVNVIFRAYGTSVWRVIDSYAYDDPYFSLSMSYIIPDSLYEQGNSFQIQVICTEESAYSPVFTISESFFSDFSLDYDFDSETFHFTASPSNVVLHFQYLGDELLVFPNITCPPYTSVKQWVYVHAPLGSTSLNLKVRPRKDCLVYATTVINGRTYTSNTIRLYGADSIPFPVPEDTRLENFAVTDIDNMVSLVYGGVTHTPIYKYVFSAFMLIVPVIGGAFVIKKFVL